MPKVNKRRHKTVLAIVQQLVLILAVLTSFTLLLGAGGASATMASSWGTLLTILNYAAIRDLIFDPC